MESTTMPVLITDGTPEYKDMQFYADLRKAEGRLNAIAAEAMKEHIEGRTLRFPQGGD